MGLEAQTTIQWNELKFDLPGKWSILTKDNKELFAVFPGTLKQITVMRFYKTEDKSFAQIIEKKTGINIEKENIYPERTQNINGIDIIYAFHAHYSSVSNETFYYYFISIPFEQNNGDVVLNYIILQEIIDKKGDSTLKPVMDMIMETATKIN